MRTALAIAALAMPSPLLAQAYACSVPATLPRPEPDLPSTSQPKRVVPIGGYTLAITWSPQSCRRPGADDRLRCRREGRGFGFTLHGLWPDGQGALWPQYCAGTGLVPPRVIEQTFCATPSPQLIQHEWAKHGTCMPGETPATYFGRARDMYQRLRYPDMDALSRRRDLTVGAFARAFAGANPGITPAMVRVTATRDGWLDELWLCRDVRFRAVACPVHQRGAAPSAPLRIWRGRRS